MGKCFTQRSLGMDPVVLNPYVMTKISQSISSYHVEMVLSFLPFLLSAHILGFLVAFSRPAHIPSWMDPIQWIMVSSHVIPTEILYSVNSC